MVATTYTHWNVHIRANSIWHVRIYYSVRTVVNMYIYLYGVISQHVRIHVRGNIIRHVQYGTYVLKHVLLSSY